jgi:hypothetical protein
MMTPKRLRRPAAPKDHSAPTSTHYSTWQPIDLSRARKAFADGATLFDLPGRYHSEGVVYVAGLKLTRGGSYLVSEHIRADLEAERVQNSILGGGPATSLKSALNVESR